MKNTTYIIILLGIVFSCQSNSIEKKCKQAILKEWEDEAFKKNIDFELLEFDIISIYSGNESIVDSIKSQKLNYRANLAAQLFENQKKTAELYLNIGITEIDHITDNMKEQADTIISLGIRDSIINERLRVNNYSNDKLYYKVKYFIKARMDTTYLDTFINVLDQNLKPVYL